MFALFFPKASRFLKESGIRGSLRPSAFLQQSPGMQGCCSPTQPCSLRIVHQLAGDKEPHVHFHLSQHKQWGTGWLPRISSQRKEHGQFLFVDVTMVNRYSGRRQEQKTSHDTEVQTRQIAQRSLECHKRAINIYFEKHIK